VPSLRGQIKYEHLHRYALSLQFVSGKSVLDIASGEGYGAALLATRASFVTGVDIDPAAVLSARQTYRNPNLSFAAGACDAIPLPDASVDAITSFETIEHHDKHEEMLREFKRVLKPGGVLIISSPNKLTYSDEPGYHNPFHVKELYYEQFDSLLKNYFKSVRNYGQRLAVGSFVFPLVDCSAEKMTPLTGDATDVASRVCSLPSPIYFVAVCSDDPAITARDLNSVFLDGADDLLKVLQAETAAAIGQMQEQVHRTEIETQAKLKQMRLDHERQIVAFRKVEAEFQELVARQSEVMASARKLWFERLTKQDEALAENRAQLAKTESLLRKRDELINAIYASRSSEVVRKLHHQEERIERLRRLAGSKNVFEGSLDSPAESMKITDSLEIGGWVLSRAGQVVSVDAFIDDFYLGSIRFVTEQKCVFRETLSLSGLMKFDGRRTLKIRVVDSSGNKHFFKRTIEVSWPPAELSATVQGFLDPETTGPGFIVVNGWAFSTAAPIASVDAFIDRVFLGKVNYGIPREDVSAMVPTAPVACGFGGTLSFTQLRLSGEKELTVRVKDEKGNTATYSRRVQLQPALFEGVLEFPKEASVCSAAIAVVGWVYSMAAPLVSVDAFIDDVHIQKMTFGIERYDVISAFPAEAPLACGFKGRISLVGSSLLGARQLTIRVRDEIGNEYFFKRAITVEPLKLSPYPAGPRGRQLSNETPDIEKQIRSVVAEFEERMDRAPSILDWDSGLNLHGVFPNLAVCSPIPSADANRLPYVDSTIDIVAIPASAIGRMEEARRVAGAAIVRGMEVEWKLEVASAVLQETSIIIPVYNNVQYTEQCLRELQRTLPRNFRGEIIVVDDASTDDTPAVLTRWAERDRRIKVVRNSQNSGFVRTCNRGAEVASGEILVFLNNDTLPLPGWLPPLLRLLRDKPDAGAVGGKLVYPDGRLQEAGGVIFSDGSGLNFGKNEDADDPVYNFVREVDYCSGALLATRRSLFLELGGFDLRYEPAYYEDTDYCFSLRRHGYRVYYQPESAIVHFEGATSGTDLQAGVKRYQTVNQAKFIEKWRPALQRQPDRLSRYDFGVRYALSMRVPMKSNHAN